MLKITQKIAISKNFLISMLFVCLIFTTWGLTIDDSYAVDLNETSAEMEIGLDVEDELENSQNEILGVANNNKDEILAAKSYTLNGGSFSDIQKVVDQSKAGDKIILKGTFVSKDSNDGIVINKKLNITSSSSAVLNGKNSVGIMWFEKGAAGSTISNLKFINGDRFRGGGIYIEGNNIVVDNCVFQKNHASVGGAGVSSVYNSSLAKNTVVKNCKFVSNTGNLAGGALGLFGKNSKVINCVFNANRVIDNVGRDCYGGAIQIGMDEPNCKGYVINCNFTNNYVSSKVGHTHGGAGCIRDGIEYSGCLFRNNSADEGGALTYHASGKVSNCTFISNTASEFGGALSTGIGLIPSMVLNIVDCKFVENEAPLGGAVQLIGSNIGIDNSVFKDNHAFSNGGAINMEAITVTLKNSYLAGNIAESDGGAVFIKGKNTLIVNSSFENNSAIPDDDKYFEGLGGAIYVNSTNTNIENNRFYYNTARNGSAVYYDKHGEKLVLVNNTMYQNQAWVYALPIFARNIYCGDDEIIGAIIHGGNNIAKYNNLAVSNAIYNAASYSKIKVDNESPVNGATNDGKLYQDDREYNMEIILTVEKDDGKLIYNKTLNSNYLGEVSDVLTNLQPGKYYVTAKHLEDTYYKAITNRTTFTVSPKIDSRIKKSPSLDSYNFEDMVIWTLNITNAGPNKATSVVVRDVLPEGLIYVRDDSGGKYDVKTGILNIGELDVGEVKIINIFTIVNKTGEIVNKANITSKEYDTNLTNNFDEASINIPPTCDVEIKKNVNVSSPNYKDLVNWSIVVRNNGPDIAHDVVVTEILPKSLIWISNTGNYDHISGIWNIGTLKVNEEVKLNIICLVNGTGIIVNDVSVSSKEFDYDLSNNNDSEVIKVSPSSDLAIVKLVNVSKADFNDLVTWKLLISNNGPDDATGVIVTDILPEGFVYVDSVLDKGSYSDGVIKIDKLAVGEKLTLSIICKVKSTGNFVNVANITGNEYDYDLSNNVDDEPIVINPATDLEVVKTVNVSNPNYGEYVTWSIVVRNNGPDVAHDVVASDVLPKSLIWISDNGNGKYDSKTGTWIIGQLNSNAVVQLDIVSKVNGTGIIQNNVSIRGHEFDYDLSNNNDSEIIEVNKTADVSVVKFVDDPNPYYGNLIKWTVIAKNNGPNKATSVNVYDILPDGLIMVDVEASKGFYENGVWFVCCLENGEEETLEIVCEVNKTGNITNVASIEAEEYDPDITNNKGNATIDVPLTVDLEVIKDVSNKNPYFGEMITWFISIKNNGPDIATNVVLYDLLDDGLIFNSYDSTVGEYANNSWIVGQLNVNEIVYLNITCIVDDLGMISNYAVANCSEYDLNISNNNDTEVIDASPVADLAVVKLVNVSSPNYDDLVKWTIIVTNNGPNDATGVLVRESLPKGLTLIRTSDFVYSDGSWYVGDLNVGEEKYLELICRVSATGTFKNIVSIQGNEFDPDVSNNNDDESIYVAPACDLKITKTASKYNYNVGDVITYSIKLTNNGPDKSRNIEVKEMFDNSLTLKSFSVSKGTFDESTKKWEIDALDNGESAELLIKAVAKAKGIVKNVVSVTSETFDHNPKNNDDVEIVNVTENNKTPKNDTNETHKFNKKHSNDVNVDKPLSLLESNVTGNPFLFSVIYALIVLILMGGCYSKKR
ncbi:hypothetical protein [Methanobrevibacter sp.]|uniref:hypothetical protein n=1 Tax=Methanobrevibacter sp. TaxID=66852 RepID=UPI002E7A70EE|nr:hypothetical protein [Methanobrevibacter sp.]MEE0938437.1 hypothetical protein [Methanobrevibacter sp.]